MRAERNRLRILLLTALLVLLSACVSPQQQTLTSFTELTTQRIGVQTGTVYEDWLLAVCPDVELFYYPSSTDMVVALDSGKLDAFLTEDITYTIEKTHFPWLTRLEGTVMDSQVAVAISPECGNTALEGQLNDFIADSMENSVLEQMEAYWIKDFDPDGCQVDKSGLTGENGVLAIAVESGFEPFSYIGKGELQGYDIDLIYRFCREYGYEPEFYTVEYDVIAVGLGSGKFDLGTSVVVSEERSEAVTLTQPYMTIGIIVATGEGEKEKTPFFASLAESFDKTFLKEDRWMLFVEGTCTTLFITILSALFGTILGFLLYLLCRRGCRIVNRINACISGLLSATPTVLLLMILYYLIFVGWADIGSIWVAIVGFSVLFGYTVFDIIQKSVDTVGKGQEEGARALGYSENQTFFQVILPQAMRHAFPLLKGEVVGLIKETSIVGYISISDLTRMSDIVRGRTYEAFFPLITTTLIYFFLIWLILLGVKRIELRCTSREKRTERFKKGIRWNP